MSGKVSGVADSWDDRTLLAALRAALSARDVVPPEFVAAGQSAFAWHNIDAELARLTYDSSGPDGQPGEADEAGQPGPALALRAEAASIRALTFTSARLTIELEVTSDSLVGQVVPVQAATIEVQARSSAPVSVPADEIGCFTIQPIPAGPFRLQCQTAAGLRVITGWITL
jgi:hypothetical protein